MISRLALALVLAPALSAVACAQSGSGEPAQQHAQSRAPVRAHGEAEARKARSEAVLRAEGVPILPSLPAIETAGESRRRQAEEVGNRAVGLVLVMLKALMAPPEKVDSIARIYGAERFLTPAERAFVAKAEPTGEELAQFSWRAESACVLLWSIGYLPDPGRPTSECNARKILSALTSRTPESFYRDARLRPQAQLLDAADLIYRYHWATEDATLHGRPVPAGLNADVVAERHYALNWLIGYEDQEWDDITTDT